MPRALHKWSEIVCTSSCQKGQRGPGVWWDKPAPMVRFRLAFVQNHSLHFAKIKGIIDHRERGVWAGDTSFGPARFFPELGTGYGSRGSGKARKPLSVDEEGGSYSNKARELNLDVWYRSGYLFTKPRPLKVEPRRNKPSTLSRRGEDKANRRIQMKRTLPDFITKYFWRERRSG